MNNNNCKMGYTESELIAMAQNDRLREIGEKLDSIRGVLIAIWIVLLAIAIGGCGN